MIPQREFRGALMDPRRDAPCGISGPEGRPAGRRFDVYRNNVAVGLTEALEAGFPVLRKLVGDAFFRAMAGVFLRAHPPRSPLMTHYGEALPGFLEGFAPAAALPYLPDVARLELALRRAYHAADAAPLDPAALGAVPPERLDRVRLRLAPPVAVLRSAHPIHGIWHYNSVSGAPKPSAGAEAVLVTRPEFDPVIDPVPLPEAEFIAALRAGRPLGEAAAAAGDDLDLASALSRLLERSALTHLQEGPTP